MASRHDEPRTLTVVAATMLGVAVAAAIVPAARASRIDPVHALRGEVTPPRGRSTDPQGYIHGWLDGQDVQPYYTRSYLVQHGEHWCLQRGRVERHRRSQESRQRA